MDRNRTFHIGSLLLLTVLALLLLGLYLRTELQITGGVIGAPLDDAWIHFQFARNISQGSGFSYNAGEATPGSTAPLWTLLLAGVGGAVGDFLRPALVMSALFLLAAVWLSYGFTYWITRALWAALAAGVAVAVTGRLLWAGLAGMETTAFAALSLAAIWTYSRSGLRWSAALLFGLATQFRPEGHALFAMAILDALGEWWAANRGDLRGWPRSLAHTFLLPLLVYAVISLPYTLFSLGTTGRPLPNTFYAKAGSQYFFSWRTLRETIAWQWQDNPASVVLLLFGLLPLWRRSRLAVLWLLGLPLFTALIIDFTWHHGRYTMPLIPLQMSAAATGAHWISLFVAKRVRGEWGALFGRLVAPLLLLVMLLGGSWRLAHWATVLGQNTREVQEIDVALGLWLAENTPSDAVIAVDDIGAIAFLSGRRIVDMNGLVSPEVWPATRADEGLPRSQILTRILSRSRPDFMAAFPLWRWDIASNTAVSKPVHHVRTETQTIIFQQDAYVYEMTWPYLAEANPGHELDAVFGEAILLSGYDVSLNSTLELVLYWRSLEPVDEDYDVFVHLVSGKDEIMAQADGKPLEGLAATYLWQPGEIIRDPRSIVLPDDVSSGSYELRVGLYDKASGARVLVQDGTLLGDYVTLDAVNIP